MSATMTRLERRKTPRLRVESIVLIDIGEDNAGIISDISEGGLCFQTAAPVEQGGTVDFCFQPDDRSQGRGRVVWTDVTQKRGGLFFTELSVQWEQIYALIEPAIPGVAAELHQGQDIATDSVQLPLISVQAEQKEWFRVFTGGLVTGVLVSLLVAAALLGRRQIGETLIVMGEHLATRSPSRIQPTHNLGETISAPNMAGVTDPQTIVTSQPESYGRTNVRDSTYTSSLRHAHSKGGSEIVGQKLQTRLGEQERSDLVAPHAVQPSATASTPNLLIHPSTRRPESPLPPSASRIAMLGLAKPSQPLPSNVADMHVEALSNSNMRSGSSSQMYFEVGRFKEHSQASDERTRLTKLGYPVTIQQRRRLWRNLYDVLVGPYHDSDEAETVHKSLVARGFQARPLERGYRHFVLPPHLLLNGVPTPVGDCVVKWESYIADVKVKFEQDDHVVSTAQGTWVKRDPKYEQSAIVYTQNRNGRRSLNELRFEGLTRALVFSN
jgi:PilZ domain/SPOR domain